MKTSKITSAAVTAPTAFVGVCFGVLVSLAAMCPLFLASYGNLLSNQIQAPSKVFAASNRFKVSRIDARANAAQMVDVVSVWYRTAKEAICNPMGQFVATSEQHEPSVSSRVWGGVSSPKPATSVRLWGNMAEKALQDRLGLCWHAAILAVDSACVMGGKYGYSA